MPRAEIPVPSEYSETRPRLLSRVKAKVQESATPAKLITAGALTSVAVILGGLATAKVIEINNEQDRPLIGAPLTSLPTTPSESPIVTLPEPTQRDQDRSPDEQERPVIPTTTEAPTPVFPSVETTIITVTVEPTTTVPPTTVTEQTTTPLVTTTEPTQTEEEIPTTTPPVASTSPTNTG